MEIKRFIILNDNSVENFNNKLAKMIKDYQDEGLYVEVQYSTSFDENFRNRLFSALVLGRGKENIAL